MCSAQRHEGRIALAGRGWKRSSPTPREKVHAKTRHHARGPRGRPSRRYAAVGANRCRPRHEPGRSGSGARSRRRRLVPANCPGLRAGLVPRTVRPLPADGRRAGSGRAGCGGGRAPAGLRAKVRPARMPLGLLTSDICSTSRPGKPGRFFVELETQSSSAIILLTAAMTRCRTSVNFARMMKLLSRLQGATNCALEITST